jgi:hypothetical protein
MAAKLDRGLLLYVKHTGTPRGRGVYAARSFLKGEVVEIAPVIVFNKGRLPIKLATVVYEWESSVDSPYSTAIALGYGSLYNHANPANLVYVSDGAALVIIYFASRNIRRNEELTINYSAAIGHCSPTKDRWFSKHRIKRL